MDVGRSSRHAKVKISNMEDFMGVIRTTVVINADGNIASYKRNVRAKGNAERTIALL